MHKDIEQESRHTTITSNQASESHIHTDHNKRTKDICIHKKS